jgi:hypothetical protein
VYAENVEAINGSQICDAMRGQVFASQRNVRTAPVFLAIDVDIGESDRCGKSGLYQLFQGTNKHQFQELILYYDGGKRLAFSSSISCKICSNVSYKESWAIGTK